MLNLDHHDQNSNNNLLQSDWHKSHGLSIDAADPTVLSVNSSRFTQDTLSGPPHSIDPVTPADAVDPNPGPVNPSPKNSGELLGAPNDHESSSSLTPAPSPENGRALSKDGQTEAKDVASVDSHNRQSPTTGLPSSNSRQSTPLTDLSNPNTPSRGKDGEEPNADHPGSSSKLPDNNNNNNGLASSASHPENTPSKLAEAERRASSGGSRIKFGESQVEGSDAQASSAGPVGVGAQQTSMGSLTTHPTNGAAISSVIDNPADHLSNSSTLKAPGEPPDEKASAILQLNAELLKVCMDFQARSLMQSPDFNAYVSRLQSNLTWLAAAADREKHKQQMALPNMSPPPHSPFYSMHAINELYERLPKLFAKEIARRQKEAAQGAITGMKRGPDPTADESNGMRKRVDTGERRQSHPPVSMAGSPPHARSPSAMSNGPINAPAAAINIGSSTGLNHSEPQLPQTQPLGGMNLGMGLQSVPSHPQLPMRVSPEAMPMGGTPQGLPSGMVEGQRPRQPSQLRPMPNKNPQPMPPATVLSNGLSNPMPVTVQQNSRASLMQLILNNFGQLGIQNWTVLQQGLNHNFVQYMAQNVPNFLQMPLEQQLQRMATVQQNIQQARQQRLAAANMNGLPGQQLLPDQSFGRQTSPPNLNPLQPQHSGQSMSHVSPSPQMPAVGFGGANGMGMGMGMQQSMQAGMQARSNPMVGQNMGGVTGMGGLPGSTIPGAGLNFNNMAPQQRQLLLMQQQMHQRNNDGVVTAQQGYVAAAQEKIRMEQQSRMSNHHTPPHSSGSPPNTSHGGIGTPVPGMTGMQSPSDMIPGTPGMAQKRPSSQMDAYQMALFNQGQQRANMAIRPGTAMGMRSNTAVGMNPPITPQHQQQRQQQQQATQFAVNGGGINPGMYGGGNGMNMTQQQTWQNPTSQQQQFHSISPAALQHHPEAGTPRPGSSASNNPMMVTEGMGDGSFDSLFNWGGT